MGDRVFSRGVSTNDVRFGGRETVVYSGTRIPAEDCPFVPDEACLTVARIPVPDNVVLCNGCNQNVAEGSQVGFLIYLGRSDLDEDRPYDFYCGQCVQRLFPRAVCVDSVGR